MSVHTANTTATSAENSDQSYCRRCLTCFRFFGQLILLFWTAGGELSDVEERFREAR